MQYYFLVYSIALMCESFRISSYFPIFGNVDNFWIDTIYIC